jgi:hypothetical protein
MGSEANKRQVIGQVSYRQAAKKLPSSPSFPILSFILVDF